MWGGCFILSMTVLALSAAGAFMLSKSGTEHRILTPFRLFAAGLFLSVFFCMLPVVRHTQIGAADTLPALKLIGVSFYSAVQVFSFDADSEMIFDGIRQLGAYSSAGAGRLMTAYSVFFSLMHIVAPFMTFTLILSFFRGISAWLRYFFSLPRDTYYFSALNEEAVTLAEDLHKNHPEARLVFAGAGKPEEAGRQKLMSRAGRLKAYCLGGELPAFHFKPHRRKDQVLLFMIGENEEENVSGAAALIRRFKNRDNTSLYVFADSPSGRLLLAREDPGRLKLRRIGVVREFLDRRLYEKGVRLYETACEEEDGRRRISVLIAGLGAYGTELLKALSWFCQMDGYTLSIDAFDADPCAADRLAAQVPELLAEECQGLHRAGTADYDIRVHAGCAPGTKGFADAVAGLGPITFAFADLGSDEANIEGALTLRTLFERLGMKPILQTIVEDGEKEKALAGAVNFRGQAYGIGTVGSLPSRYCEADILHSELEEKALEVHRRYGGSEESFWRYEYNYRSSAASAIHAHLRQQLGREQGEEEIARQEHARWMAYVRSEGYVYSGSSDPASRNDLGRLHPDLVPYEALSGQEKEKDKRTAGAISD